MRRRLALAVTFLIFLGGFDSATAAAVIKPGGTCPKAGAIQSYAGKSYVCAKKGTRLTWILVSTPIVVKPTSPAPSITPNPVPVVTQAPIAIETQAPISPKIPAELSYLENVLGEPLFTVIGTPNDICQIVTTQTNGTGVKQAVILDDFGKYQFTLTKSGLGTSATVQAKCTKSGEALAAYEAPKPVVKSVKVTNFPATVAPGQVVKYQVSGSIDDQCSQQSMYPGSAATSKNISLGKTGTLENTLTIGSATGLLQIEIICKVSGNTGISSQVEYAIVKLTIGGIPTQMAPLEKFTWTLKATPNDTCEISTTFPGQSATTQSLTLKTAGTASTPVTLGSRTGQLIYSITCAKSGSAIAISNVSSSTATTPAPTVPAPTVPSPTTSTSGRLSKICITADPGVPFTTGCQSDFYPYWNLSFCTPRTTSSWALYSYSRDGSVPATIVLFDLPMSRVNWDNGTDMPSICPDSAKPLAISIGDMIPKKTLNAETFVYALRRTYKNPNGTTASQDYLIKVSVS
ncbi:MAG: hypothetical protein WCI25_09135 [Actinomycetes bacterium]